MLQRPSEEYLTWILIVFLSELLHGRVIILLGSNDGTEGDKLQSCFLRCLDVALGLTPWM